VDGCLRTLLVCCGALAREVVAMVEGNGWDHMTVQCLPAHLHNAPDRIPEAVRDRIRAGRGQFDRFLVLFSDCGTGGQLDRVLDEEGVERIGGTHCYEVFAGVTNYAAMMKEEPGSFFLTDFLVRHFDRLILQGMGIERFPRLRNIYFGKYKKVVYLAQTENPELVAKAEAAAARLGLEFEMRFTGYGDFERFLASRQA
jgi:hypothetical protein